MWRRIAALPRAARLNADVHLARRREARALAAAGEAAADLPVLGTSGEVAHAVAHAATLRARRDAARSAEAASLDADRADWADAPPWLKLVIVARGLFVRGVARAQRRRIERELAVHLGTIGAEAIANPQIATTLPDHVRGSVEQERARAELAAAERAQLLAPFGGRALPMPVGAGLRELSRASVALGRELRSRLVPRLPGVVGLAAGWWVAHAFTGSRWADLTERLGLRHGGPWVVSGETYERLEFWVPLVTAAVCAYLGSRLWGSLERRYTVGVPGRQSEELRQERFPSDPGSRAAKAGGEEHRRRP